MSTIPQAPKASESAIQKAILDYLAARHVLAFRMNSGTMTSEYKGKKRFMRFGVPGMADILAFPKDYVKEGAWAREEITPTWIEVKAEKGKQSELQKSFQSQIEAEGHRYIVAKSIEDVEAAL